MGRGIVHVGVWVAVTAAAVTLSWFGVRSVLRGTAYDPPRALPIAGATPPPTVSATRRPSPEPRPSRPPASRSASAPPARTATATAPAPVLTPTGTAAAGAVHGYTVRGGRVVLDLGARSASLVSATPNAGWQMRVWTESGWLRVTFTSRSGAQASDVFCTWNGHPPTVQAFED